MKMPSFRHSILALATIAPLTLFAACSGSAEDDDDSPEAGPTADCTGAVPTYTELSSGMLTSCTSCHASTLVGGARAGAPSDVNFDSYSAAKEHAAHGADEIYSGAMPLPDPSALSASDAQLFYTWALCETPE